MSESSRLADEAGSAALDEVLAHRCDADTPAPDAKHPTGQICPVHRTLDIIGKRWTALIIRDLMSGPKRFSELMRSLDGVTPRMLSQRLDELEGHAIVTRTVYSEVPPRVEYALTEKGHALRQLVDDMAEFGGKWL